MEADLKEMNSGVEALERNLVELQELHHVLRYTEPFFEHVSWCNLSDIHCCFIVYWVSCTQQN